MFLKVIWWNALNLSKKSISPLCVTSRIFLLSSAKKHSTEDQFGDFAGRNMKTTRSLLRFSSHHCLHAHYLKMLMIITTELQLSNKKRRVCFEYLFNSDIASYVINFPNSFFLMYPFKTWIPSTPESLIAVSALIVELGGM